MRGPQELKAFSDNLVKPVGAPGGGGGQPGVGYVNPLDDLRRQLAAAQDEVAGLRALLERQETSSGAGSSSNRR